MMKLIFVSILLPLCIVGSDRDQVNKDTDLQALLYTVFNKLQQCRYETTYDDTSLTPKSKAILSQEIITITMSSNMKVKEDGTNLIRLFFTREEAFPLMFKIVSNTMISDPTLTGLDGKLTQEGHEIMKTLDDRLTLLMLGGSDISRDFAANAEKDYSEMRQKLGSPIVVDFVGLQKINTAIRATKSGQ